MHPVLWHATPLDAATEAKIGELIKKAVCNPYRIDHCPLACYRFTGGARNAVCRTTGDSIACSPAADEVQIRVAEWQEVLTNVRKRRPIDGGVRLVFEPCTPAAAVADLAAREHACCPFLDFSMPVSAEAPVLFPRTAEATGARTTPQSHPAVEHAGMSGVALADGVVHDSYFRCTRGLEAFNICCPLLDRAPKGREEDDPPFDIAWLGRHHVSEPSPAEAS